jgi:hypothetical protein
MGEYDKMGADRRGLCRDGYRMLHRSDESDRMYLLADLRNMPVLFILPLPVSD